MSMTRQVADQAPGRVRTYLCGYDSVLLYFRFPLVGLYPMTIAPPRRRWLRSSSSSSDDGATRGQGRPPARFPREIRVPTGSTRSGVNARLRDATCPGKTHLGLRSRHSSAAVVVAGSARNRALRWLGSWWPVVTADADAGVPVDWARRPVDAAE
jgi:hypothetical protein